MSVLTQAQAAGSLEYWGSCGTGERPDFPRLRTDVQHRASTVELLREIFSVDPQMRISKDAEGAIRMTEVDVPLDLLKVKISQVSFKAGTEPPWEAKNVLRGGGEGLYDPDDALRHILSTPEVVKFRKAHDIGPFDFEQVTGDHEEVSAHSAHISGELNDITLSQALDAVLGVFPGIWVYENCPSKVNARQVVFKFYRNGPMWDIRLKHSNFGH